MIFISAEGDSARVQEVYIGRTNGAPIRTYSAQWHAPAAVAALMDSVPVAFVRDRGDVDEFDVAVAYRNGYVQACATRGTWARCDLWVGERYLGTIWLKGADGTPPRRPPHVTEGP